MKFTRMTKAAGAGASTTAAFHLSRVLEYAIHKKKNITLRLKQEFTNLNVTLQITG